MTQPLTRLLILPALAALLRLAVSASPASAFEPAPAKCPCWDAGGPFYTPAVLCYGSIRTRARFGFIVGTFAQVVNYGPVSFFRKDTKFIWTTPAEHQACSGALHLACSPLLAVAYIDLNNNDVFDYRDGLIGKLVDANGNGDADSDDIMVNDVYPTSPGARSPRGTFNVKATPCSMNAVASGTTARCVVPDGDYTWDNRTGQELFAGEVGNDLSVNFVDGFNCSDRVEVPLTSPLDPTASADSSVCQFGDQNFLDVDIFVTPRRP